MQCALPILVGPRFLTEGAHWFNRALASCTEDAEIRAKALQAYGGLELHLSNYGSAAAAYGESLRIRTELKDKRGIALSRMGLGYLATERGDLEEARQHYLKAKSVLETMESERDLAVCYMNLGMLSLTSHDIEQAHAELEQTRSLYAQCGDSWGAACATLRLATTHRLNGEISLAVRCIDSAQSILVEVNDEPGLANCMRERSYISLAQQHLELALVQARESLDRTIQIGDRKRAIECLDTVASCLAGAGHDVDAVRLFSASLALRRQLHAELTPHETSVRQVPLEQLERRMGKRCFDQAWHDGMSMSLESALDQASGGLTQPRE